MKIEQEGPSFTCEICGDPADVINLLPIKQPDGKLDTLACTSCAQESGVFCNIHQRPHLGFADGTTACKVCIDDQVEADTPEIASNFFREIDESPHKKKVLKELKEWSEALEAFGLPYETNVTRAVVTVALRLKKTTEEIIKQVCEEGPEVILPHYKEDGRYTNL